MTKLHRFHTYNVNESVNEASKPYKSEKVKHRWFETGEGTMFTDRNGLIGFVYELDGKWIALGGLDEADGKKALRELANGKMDASRGWSATLDSFEDAEQELVSAVLDKHSLQQVAKSIKFPSGSARKEYGGSIHWSKRGGHAGDKIVQAVLYNAKKSGWKVETDKQTNNATGDVVTNIDALVDPTGRYKLTGYSKYGVTSSDNWYDLKLSQTKQTEK